MRRFDACARGAVLLGGVILAAACGTRTTPVVPDSERNYALEIVAGDGQSQAVGTALAERLVVLVTEDGVPAPGIVVDWSQTADGSVFPLASVTDAQGLTEVEAVLPTTGGHYAFTARAGSATVEYTLDAEPVVVSASPVSAPAGMTITISGEGFDADAASNVVRIDGVDAAVSSATGTTLDVVVPDVDVGELLVTTNDVVASKGITFGTLTDRAPTSIYMGAACTPRTGTTTRNIGVDADNRIYVAFWCQTPMADNPSYVMISTDGGASFSAPVEVSADSVQVSVAGGRAGEVVVAWENNGIYVSRSDDAGATWSAPVEVIPNLAADDPSITLDGDRIYIAGHSGNNAYFVFSPDAGATWSSVQQPGFMAPITGLNVVVDEATADVWLGTTTDMAPTLRVRQSVDGGQSFGGQDTVNGNATTAVWGAHGGYLWAIGDNGNAHRINMADTSDVTDYNIENADASSMTIAIDSGGDVFIAGTDGGNGLFTQHLQSGQASFTAAATLSATGDDPSLVIASGVRLLTWEQSGTSELYFASQLQ